MKKGLAYFFVFVLGAGAGAAGAYIYTKQKYDSLIEEEVSSARETYNRLAKELADKNEAEKQKMFTEYTEKVENYISDVVNSEPEENAPQSEEMIVKEIKPADISSGSERIDPNTPYEIDPSEYGSNEDYDLVSLTYYSDEIVTNDVDEIIDDAATLIGQKLLDKLAVYEMNGIYTAYARNDVRRCDYEILLTGHDYDGE